jgi:hypothetical protein
MVGTSPNSIGLADLDGDGVLDILAPDPSSRNILILWESPTEPSTRLLSIPLDPAQPLSPSPTSMATSIPDLVTPNQGSGDFSILLGNGDGSFRVLSRRCGRSYSFHPPHRSAWGISTETAGLIWQLPLGRH